MLELKVVHINAFAIVLEQFSLLLLEVPLHVVLPSFRNVEGLHTQRSSDSCGDELDWVMVKALRHHWVRVFYFPVSEDMLLIKDDDIPFVRLNKTLAKLVHKTLLYHLLFRYH